MLIFLSGFAFCNIVGGKGGECILLLRWCFRPTQQHTSMYCWLRAVDQELMVAVKGWEFKIANIISQNNFCFSSGDEPRTFCTLLNYSTILLYISSTLILFEAGFHCIVMAGLELTM